MSISSSRLDPSAWCAPRPEKLFECFFINQTLVESLLLADHGDVSCWDQARDGGEKARLSTIRLTYEVHDPLFVLFNAAVKESNVILAKCTIPSWLRLFCSISLKYPGSGVLVCW